MRNGGFVLEWDRWRRHGVSLVLAAVAPFLGIGIVVLALTAAARPHDTTVEELTSPTGARSVVVQRSGGDAGRYLLTTHDHGASRRVGCVDAQASGQPLVQWVDDDRLRVSVLDAGATRSSTLLWAPAGQVNGPVEQPRLALLHAC